MLRKLILAAGMLAASGAAFAYDGHGRHHGRVISVEPSVSISFGNPYHDGFRVQYESGGRHYWTHSPYHPGPVIVVPSHQVRHVYHHRGWDKHHRGWDKDRWDRHDRRDWRDDRHERRHERRHHWD